jgi:hypothetical protein
MTAAPGAEAPSGLPANALDLAYRNSIGLGDLGGRHAVFYPGANADEL